MKNKLALATLLLGLMLFGSATNVLAQENWHVIPSGAPFDLVEAYITKTYSGGSVEFKVEIVPDAPHYGMGIAISTDISTIDFQVWYADYMPDPNKGWYYQLYPWSNPYTALASSGTGITATGDHTGKIFTVTIPLSLLGGYNAIYYFAIQFRTTLIGTLPQGLNLWAQTDATLFEPNQTPAPPVGGEWVPINAIQVLIQIAGSVVAMSAIAVSFVGFKRMKKKQN